MFKILKKCMCCKSSFVTQNFNRLKSKRTSVAAYKKVMNLPDYKKIFVWNDNEGKNVQLQLGFRNLKGELHKIVMNRLVLDSFNSTKRRIEEKLVKTIQNIKRQRKRKDNVVEVISEPNELTGPLITPCGIVVNSETTNMDVFYGCDSVLIGADKYVLVRDQPMLLKLTISLTPIVGCPVIPSCDWKISAGEPLNIKFYWFVAENPNDLIIERNSISGDVELKNWQIVHIGEIFVPSKEQIGRQLSVVVDFGEDLLIKAAVASSPVIDIGEELIFESRQANQPFLPLNKKKFRILCYNILADLYINLKLEQSKLFFAYCPVAYQEAAYRYPLILREIQGYNSDLICLQEVDNRMQMRFLAKVLRHKGFDFNFKCKANVVNEGLVIAYRTEKFRKVDISDLDFPNFLNGIRVSDLINIKIFPKNSDIADYLQKNLKMLEYIQTRPTVLQLIQLESVVDLNVRLLVANTHLVFDPAYENIKLIQAILSIRYLSEIKEQIKLNEPTKQVYLLFCGDFNSTPDSGVVQIFSQGHIEADSPNWYNSLGGIEVNEVKFKSLLSFPDYTNFTRSEGKGYVGCLDYIWSQPALHVDRVIPFPDHHLVTKYAAIPSKIAPSDHLALVVDVEFLPPAS